MHAAMHRRISRILVPVLLGVAVLFQSGCESLIMGKPKEPENVTGLRITPEQLRLRVRVMVNPLSGMVIEAANEIIVESLDPSIQREALIWKADAVPVLRESLFKPSPVMAIIDVWALSFQMMDYFETGPGATRLGDQAPIAQAACREINRYIEDILLGLSVEKNLEEAITVVRGCTSKNPITDRIAARESISNQVTEITLALGFSLGDVVDTMVTTVDDLNRKVDVYSRQVPSQARWQAELFATEAVERLGVAESVGKLPDVMDAAIKAMPPSGRALSLSALASQSRRTTSRCPC